LSRNHQLVVDDNRLCNAERQLETLAAEAADEAAPHPAEDIGVYHTEPRHRIHFFPVDHGERMTGEDGGDR
jgi:hypothetical protein